MKTPTDVQKEYLKNAKKDGIEKFLSDPANIETFFYLRSMPAKRYSINNTFILLSQLAGSNSRPYKLDNRALQILTRDEWWADFGANVPEELTPMLVWAGSDGMFGIEEVFTNKDIVIPRDISDYSPNTLEVKPVAYEMLFSAILYVMRYGNKAWSEKNGTKHQELPGFFSNVLIEKNAVGKNDVSVDENRRAVTVFVSPVDANNRSVQQTAANLLFQLISTYLTCLLPRANFEKSHETQLFNEIIELASFYSVISKGCYFNRHIKGEKAFINKPEKLLARLQAVESLKQAIDSAFHYYQMVISEDPLLNENTEEADDDEQDT